MSWNDSHQTVELQITTVPATNYHWFVVPRWHLNFEPLPPLFLHATNLCTRSKVPNIVTRPEYYHLLALPHPCPCRVPNCWVFMMLYFCRCLLAFLTPRLGLPLDKLGTFAAAPLLSECVRVSRIQGCATTLSMDAEEICFRMFSLLFLYVFVVAVVLMVVLYWSCLVQFGAVVTTSGTLDPYI